MRFLILGCGYVGSALGQCLIEKGHEVKGVVQSSESTKALERAGITFSVSDCSTPVGAQIACRERADVVVFSMSSRGGDYQRTYVDGMRHVLQALESNPPRMLIYTGSTSVYAQSDGEWVDENSESNPSHEKGKLLLQVESLLERSTLVRNGMGIVLRISGIYGPGRHSLLTQLREGISSFPGTGERWLNQIHRDDVVGAIVHLAQMNGKRGFAVYNLTDDLPVRQCDYVTWVCQQLGRKPPVYDSKAVPTSRWEGDGVLRHRRISNHLLRETGWVPRFPTYREGLQALLA